MKWLRLIVAAIIVAAATAVAVWLPPAPEPLALTSTVPIGARGAIHIHTRRSDGTGTIDDVAAAAARAGLKFIIVTDHGDATREPDPPVYKRGVLCIDAVEISTEGGHVVALGLGQAPYPLGGEPRDVIDDIARLGGFSIAAHPGSTKPDLRWIEWTAAFGGIEWLNGDSEWRDETRMALVRALFTYPFRPAPTLARLLDRPDDVLRRWDVLTQRRRVVAVAAGDAHARLGLRSGGEPGTDAVALHLPDYEEVFRTFSIVVPQLRFSGDATQDARQLLDQIRAGHVFSSIDALASPAAMSFTASSGTMRASGGDVLPIGGPVDIRVASNAPGGSRIVLLKDGRPVASSTEAALEFSAPASAAVYRAEIALNHAPGEPPVPWIVSNPIYVGRPATDVAAPARGPANEFAVQYDNGPAAGWEVEKSPGAAAAFEVVRAVGGGTQLSWRYALGGVRSEAPFAALAMPAGPALSGYDRLVFTARADKPMRVSVQLRVPAGPQGERWHRSVYVDETAREISVFFDEMTPRGFTSTRRPVLSKVQAILWVVDPVNTPLGGSGQVWIDDVKYGR